MATQLLVVEDHADSLMVMAKLLRHAGYEVAEARTCAEALQLAPIVKPRVLVCDIGLPDGDGCDLLRELKRQYHISGIAVTGNAFDQDELRYRDAGFSGFIRKPCTVQQITEELKRVVQEQPFGAHSSDENNLRP